MRIGPLNAKTHPAIVAEASAWFIEFRAGDVTGDARLRFIDWLRRSPEHIQAYLEISGVWADLPSTDPAGKIDLAAMIARARGAAEVIELYAAAPTAPGGPPTSRVPRARDFLLRPTPRRALLAATALGLLAMVTVRYWTDIFSDSYATDIGEQRTIQLADGSTVELNARSRLQVHLTQQQRDVVLLEGQALFRVAKDKQRPFVVHIGDERVRAVGTEFDVYKKAVATVVTVVEGRVEAYDQSDNNAAVPTLLSAGEQLTVVPHIAAKPAATDTTVATAWVQKRLMFEETPLGEVAEEFNRYNRRPLTIDDRELRRVKISGVYSSTDPASLINFLRGQNSMQIIETEKQVRLVRRDAH
jgi:transmembrane sensor